MAAQEKRPPPSGEVIGGDCLEVMRGWADETIDLIVTDPPYGLHFMGLDFDKALPPVAIWKECLRVLKPGAFAFVMSIPRQDCLARMITNLADAGFDTGYTSLYHVFAQGFPKAENISKAVDKRECVKQLTEKLGRKPTKEEFAEAWRTFRPVVGTEKVDVGIKSGSMHAGRSSRVIERDKTVATSPEAQDLDGAYSFNPKPAVEVVLVAMKPLAEKTFVAQALKNGKGVTWLDDVRIPFASESDRETHHYNAEGMDRLKQDYGTPLGTLFEGGWAKKTPLLRDTGRFPANLLVSDDALNDGKAHSRGEIHGTFAGAGNGTIYGKYCERQIDYAAEKGTFSRYFSLDAWWERNLAELPENMRRTFPFLVVPKASKREKESGLGKFPPKASNRRVSPEALKLGTSRLGCHAETRTLV